MKPDLLDYIKVVILTQLMNYEDHEELSWELKLKEGKMGRDKEILP